MICTKLHMLSKTPLFVYNFRTGRKLLTTATNCAGVNIETAEYKLDELCAFKKRVSFCFDCRSCNASFCFDCRSCYKREVDDERGVSEEVLKWKTKTKRFSLFCGKTTADYENSIRNLFLE